MSTSWKSEDVASSFEDYDDLPERTIGYPTVFEQLGLADAAVNRVLDYGCGPGKVAERVVNGYDVTVTAVDSSPPMLDIARRTRAHPRIDYRQVTDETLDFLPDNEFDAAMTCLVFINVGDEERIRRVVSEAYRVLRPGARYAVLDTNPNTTGVQFSTFRNGDPDTHYEAGAPRRVLLDRPGGGIFELNDFHWPMTSYRKWLTEAGFRDVTSLEPVLGKDLPAPDAGPAGRPWGEELRQPPFLITVGTK